MLLLKDECSLCKRVVPRSYLRRCLRCKRLYCFDCTMFTSEGYITCLNCARRQVSPRKLGTKYSPLSRYLLRRATFTERAVLKLTDIEGIIGNNLPLAATRAKEWWSNARSTAQGKSWVNVGWNVEKIDLDKRTVVFVHVAKPEGAKPIKKRSESRKTEFFKRPLKFPRQKRPLQPSKTKVARVQARVKNIERRRSAGLSRKGKPRRSAHEKRLFKPEAKP